MEEKCVSVTHFIFYLQLSPVLVDRESLYDESWRTRKNSTCIYMASNAV